MDGGCAYFEFACAGTRLRGLVDGWCECECVLGDKDWMLHACNAVRKRRDKARTCGDQVWGERAPVDRVQVGLPVRSLDGLRRAGARAAVPEQQLVVVPNAAFGW